MIEEAAGLFVAEAGYLAEETRAEVIACAVPPELVRLIDREDEPADAPAADAPAGRWQFHDVLKARGPTAKAVDGRGRQRASSVIGPRGCSASRPDPWFAGLIIPGRSWLAAPICDTLRQIRCTGLVVEQEGPNR
jgi:hypothetical protein